MDTREQQDLCYPAARFHEKGVFASVGGWRCSKVPLTTSGEKNKKTKTKWICHILFGVERFLS
jgi:hypothetical protein